MLNIKIIYFNLDDTILAYTTAERNALGKVYDHFGWDSKCPFDKYLPIMDDV